MKYVGHIIAIIATVLLVMLFISNKDLRLQRDVYQIQIEEISRQDEIIKTNNKKLESRILDFKDSITDINSKLELQKKKEQWLIINHERRLAEASKLNEQQADTFLTNRYPDSRAVVRDLVAFEHCKEMLINKDGKIILLEKKTIIQDSIIISQDSIIFNLNKRLLLAQESVELFNKIAENNLKHMKRMRRQRNGAIVGGIGIAVLSLIFQ